MDGAVETLVQVGSGCRPAHGPQIHRLAMAEALDGQAEATEDALHRQADHGHQLADPLLPGEGQHLAEDDAGEFADAVLQARARSASMAGGSAPTRRCRAGASPARAVGKMLGSM